MLVGLATEAVNNGDKLPTVRLVTVPPDPPPPQALDHPTMPANQQNACVDGPEVGGAIDAGGMRLGGGVGTVRTWFRFTGLPLDGTFHASEPGAQLLG